MSFWKTLGDVAGSAATGNILGAGMSLLGNLFGSNNNDNTNKYNYAIAQMNNATQVDMFNHQLDYNYQMWKENNYYNRPDQQVARMKAAGLNPYMQGAVGSGVSSSPASGVTPPSLSTPTMQSYDPSASFTAAGHHLAAAAMAESQRKNVDEDTKSKSIDNITRNAENLARIDAVRASAKDSRSRAALNKIDHELKKATFESVVFNQELQNESLETQIELNYQTALGIHLDNILKDARNKNYPAEFAASIAEIWSRVGLNKANTGMALAQTKKLAQDVIESEARVRNINLDTATKEKLQSSMVRSAAAAALRSEEEAENVELFGTPNPVSTVDINQSIGGKFGVGTNTSGYNNITSAKNEARKNRDASNKKYRKK